MTQSFEQAQWYIHSLTGHPDTVMDWRMIHDKDKGVPAHNERGSLTHVWNKLQEYNNSGWGIFVCINQMDGVGREMSNVQYLCAHVVDMDNPLNSAAAYQRAARTHPQPHFAVQSSPNKYHVYWLVEPYVGNEYYTIQQRKLAQIYDGDPKITDATRVLRVPGFFHLKNEPFLTTCWAIGQHARWNVQTIADSLAHVNVINHVGLRSPLGDAEMQAPSIEWLNYALHLIDPNSLDRNEWLSISAAFKQAGWNLTSENDLRARWEQWCNKYEKNDIGENLKLWNSVRNTETGWQTFERRTPVTAWMMHGYLTPPVETPAPPPPPAKRNHVHRSREFPEILSAADCSEWFKDCYFIARLGEIFSPQGRYMNPGQFNGLYGGKHFIITEAGKTTDEAWKAALRSTQWTIPKVDHVRFLPDRKPGEIVEDRLGRTGLNTYIPVLYDAKEGDISLFWHLICQIIPDENDRRILIEFMAHAVKYPGVKIPWGPMIQSTEGVGKSIFFKVMEHALGEMYIYKPNVKDLVESGSKFNAWMRGKLCILAEEIKVDERRDLIEILKPMITDDKIEVQAKGQDQEMEDNPANWMFMSNYKEAIPIHKSGRRYAIFYSALQSKFDLEKAGMGDDYFNRLFTWLEDGGGFQAVTYWLLNYPIQKGAIPKRAPITTSYVEALHISRSPMQIIIEDAIQDNLQGFRNGYISSIAVTKAVTRMGIKAPAVQSVRKVLEEMGYKELGRSPHIFMQEDLIAKTTIFANEPHLKIEDFAVAQGYT